MRSKNLIIFLRFLAIFLTKNVIFCTRLLLYNTLCSFISFLGQESQVEVAGMKKAC